jgi:hypothetical protein
MIDLLNSIERNIKGVFLDDCNDYDSIDYITRRDLYSVATQFKRKYDIYVCAQGYNFLHIKLITDYGLVDINITKI